MNVLPARRMKIVDALTREMLPRPAHGFLHRHVNRFRTFDVNDLADIASLPTSLKGRRDSGEVVVLDTAFWVKGCSSLGRLRYAVLLDVDGGVVQGDDLCLIDIKEGVKPAAPHYDDVATPRDNALRVLEGARNLSPYLGERMRAARLLDRGVVIRGLLPQDMKLEIEQLGKDDAMHVALQRRSSVKSACRSSGAGIRLFTSLFLVILFAVGG